MKPEGSLQCLHEPGRCLHPELDESSPPSQPISSRSV